MLLRDGAPSRGDAHRDTARVAAVLTYTSRMRSSVLLALVLAIAASSPPRLDAQQPQQPTAPPTFRSSVTLVTVDVSVLDRDGKPVPGLTADDFQIKLNGKLQPVRALS